MRMMIMIMQAAIAMRHIKDRMLKLSSISGRTELKSMNIMHFSATNELLLSIFMLAFYASIKYWGKKVDETSVQQNENE